MSLCESYFVIVVTKLPDKQLEIKIYFPYEKSKINNIHDISENISE